MGPHFLAGHIDLKHQTLQSCANGDVLSSCLDNAGGCDGALKWREGGDIRRRARRYRLRLASHVVKTQAAHRQGQDRQGNANDRSVHWSPPATIWPSLISTMRSPNS